MTVRYRKMPSGSLVTPHQGKPPVCPDGYIRSDLDPYVFNPILEACSDRKIQIIERGCCSDNIKKIFCGLMSKHVQPGDCKTCIDAQVKSG